MKLYNEVCPNCGTLNRSVDLEETNGMYECENCKSIIHSEAFHLDLAEIPFFDLGDPIDQIRLIEFCKKKDVPEFKFRKIAKAN